MDLSKVPAAQRADYLRKMQEIEGVPPAVRAAIADEVINSQRVIKQALYYSTVKFATTRSGAGPFTYTCDTSDRQAFVFAQGQSMGAAGFASTVNATFADTNLRTGGGQTNNNADCVIWSIGIEVLPTSEPRLVAELVRQVFINMSLDGGGSRTLIGKLSDFSSGGALYGGQHTKLEAGSILETIGPVESFISNGNPMAGNWYQLKKPIRWNSLASKKPDSNLAVVLTPGAAVTLTATDRAAVAGAAPGASGRVEAFTSPADGARGTFAEFRVKMLCVEVYDRSLNQ